MLKITNTQKGPRGVNVVGGPIIVDPGQTVEVEVYAREKEHLDASGWFTIKGDYQANPDAAGRAPTDNDVIASKDAEIAELRKQLADKSGGGNEPSERDELKKQADELGIEYARNIPTDKLKELVDAKLAE